VETDFCKVKVRDMWHEMYKLGRDGKLPRVRMQREKRGTWMFGQYIPDRDPGTFARAAPVVAVDVRKG
jgi:hypothetical protein